jgi:hypothetical protein
MGRGYLPIVAVVGAVTAAGALGGCARLLGLEEPMVIDAAARADGAVGDAAPVDAAPCFADEDLDGVVDAYDRCPGIPGVVNDTDADGDGIGDACDPSPDRNRGVAFDGFSCTPSAWSGDWTEEPGVRRFSVGSGAIVAATYAPSVQAPLALEGALVTDGTPGTNAVFALAASTGTNGVLCQVQAGLLGLRVNLQGPPDTVPVMPAIGASERVRLRLAIDGGVATCALFRGGGQPATLQHATAATPTELEVAAQNLNATLDYVAVYDLRALP